MKAPLLSRRSALSIAAVGAGALVSTKVNGAEESHSILELRQYKIVAGMRDKMIDLFERNFVESQEAVGARILGTFRDVNDPSRFTWLRSFSNMAARQHALEAFYFGPVWQAKRAEANPLLDDNDNVLMLRSAAADSEIADPSAPRASIATEPPVGGLVVTFIYYLWKEPGEQFAAFFRDSLSNALNRAGFSIIGSYVREAQPNNFPRLAIREGEKVFVVFVKLRNSAAYAKAQAFTKRDAQWTEQLNPKLADLCERQTQMLLLHPTRRSWLR